MLVSYAKRGRGRRWPLKFEDLEVNVGYGLIWTKEGRREKGGCFSSIYRTSKLCFLRH